MRQVPGSAVVFITHSNVNGSNSLDYKGDSLINRLDPFDKVGIESVDVRRMPSVFISHIVADVVLPIVERSILSNGKV